MSARASSLVPEMPEIIGGFLVMCFVDLHSFVLLKEWEYP